MTESNPSPFAEILGGAVAVLTTGIGIGTNDPVVLFGGLASMTIITAVRSATR